MTCVNVMVQALVPVPVVVVLEVVPEKVVDIVPEPAALPLLVVILVKSVLRLAKIEIVSPAVGAVLEVNVVAVWLPDEERLLTNPAHCVAVTVPPVDTVLSAVCPHPLSVAPVPQISFRLAPEFVDTKPL